MPSVLFAYFRCRQMPIDIVYGVQGYCNIGLNCCCVCQHHCWYFTPNAAEKFVLKPVLSAWCVRQSSRLSDGKVTNMTVRVIGEGATGCLVVRLPALSSSSFNPLELSIIRLLHFEYSAPSRPNLSFFNF